MVVGQVFGLMQRCAVIHVGLEKTGSTAIQSWLHANRHALLDRHILVPQSLGTPNQTRLVAACLDDGVTDNIKAHFLSRENLTEGKFRKKTKAAFDVEVAASKDWSTLVITSELISSRLFSPTEIAHLVDWLRPHVDRMTFVIYLRRQDDLAVSRYSSALRAGHFGFDDIWADLSANSFPIVPPERSISDYGEYFDYNRILGRFDDIPNAEVIPQVYDPSRAGGNIVEDFARLLGLPDALGGDGARRANPALSAEAQYIISELNRDNRVQWPSGARNEPYRALLRSIETDVGGTRRAVPRAEAVAFMDRFWASNEAVVRRWFPDSMFGDRFEQWPETADYRQMQADLQPVLDKYRSIAAKLPGSEPSRSDLKRLWSGLSRWIKG
jgi:hypothetical protein